MNQLLVKILNILKFISFIAISLIIKLKKHVIVPKTLLLIRLDAIGDYILFRNFIEVIRKSEKYKGYKITLCGNMIWKELAENLDSKFIDEFIWIDRKKFSSSILYKYNVLSKIYELGFETAIESTYTREILFGDSIIKISCAKNKIGTSGAPVSYSKWKRNLLTDRYFTKLVPIPEENLFEFDVNTRFFKSILAGDFEISKPFITKSNLPAVDNISKHYIVLFPGSNEKNKMWSSKNFKTVSEFILKHYSFDIILSGSKAEKYLFEQIALNEFKQRFVDYFGCSLIELAKLISDAKLLISNDTSSVHFAAAVDTPFICIASGLYYGRFNPYPKHIFDKAHYIFPQDFIPGKWTSMDKISPQALNSIIENILS
jgi:ADP-heptose:LPS heptosyltransferase